MRYLFTLLFTLILFVSDAIPQSNKIDLWKKPSFFRGYNILRDNPKSLKDFIDLKNAGANFAYIGSSGFYYVESPYAKFDTSVTATDSLVAWAHEAGLYYAITIRSGPGRRDVYLESIGFPKSTIWTNHEEQKLYAGMVREITERYISDPLFVGIAPFMEPNPLFDSLYINPDYLENMLKNNNIDINKINQIMLDSIRTVSMDIPVILQSAAYSCPEFISLLKVSQEPNIVYEFHSYRPTEYVKETKANTKKYPDKYISFYNLAMIYHDKTYISDSICHRVRELQKKSNAPILLGEFGLMYPQINGIQFLKDITDICIESGWHFAYWDWRDHPDSWNLESFDEDYWDAVKSTFYKNVDVKDNSKEQSGLEVFFQNGQLIIKSRDIPNDICFYDLLGRKVTKFNEQISSNKLGTLNYIDLNSLNFGIYYIEVKLERKVYFVKTIIDGNALFSSIVNN